MIQPPGFPPLPLEFEYETEVHESLDREHSLFFNIFRKKNVTPKRALLIIHGQGEHGGRYLHFPHYLKDDYDLIIAPDLRGHGRSEGIRGHVESFDEYVDDAMLAWDILCKKIDSSCERDWFGHSMGGLITLRAFLYREIALNHVILSSPLVAMAMDVPLIKRVAATVLNRVWGSLQLPTGIDAKNLSHDPAVVETHAKDLLNHDKATPTFYLSMIDAMAGLQGGDFHFNAKTPILMQLAGEDPIVSTPAAKEFFEHLRHEKKTLIVYPGLFHEIYNEVSKELVFEDWIRWLRANS
jgi:alpha-beta hydrolase superfamily lysophospholipase